MTDTTNLLPKDGEQTSSFKVAILSALAPAVLAVALIAGASFTPYLEVRTELLGLLKYVVMAGGLGAAAVNFQFVRSRGALSVAKLDAYTAINAPATQPKMEVNIDQSSEGAKG